MRERPRSSIGGFLFESFRSVDSSSDDCLVTGAAAQMAGQDIANAVFVGAGFVTQQRIQGHQYAGGAKTALKGVMPAKGLLQYREPAGDGGKTFHSVDRRAFDLHGKRETAARQCPVNPHGACATYAVFTAYMRARRSKFAAQEVAQQHAGLDPTFDRATVESETHLVNFPCF
jgi:hypothetical protein